jgi:hypothetical protein
MFLMVVLVSMVSDFSEFGLSRQGFVENLAICRVGRSWPGKARGRIGYRVQGVGFRVKGLAYSVEPAGEGKGANSVQGSGYRV